MTRIGIIGCGMIARFHAQAILETGGCVLAGCASHSPASATGFAARFGIPAHDSIESLVSSGTVDAVAICTPSGAHLEPALLAADAGLHLVVEKPLEVTLERCDQLLAAVRKSGVRLATVFQSRFSPVWQRIKQVVDAGGFGQLAVADAHLKWFRPQSYYDSAEWRGTWRLDGGGALMNQGIHSVDLLLWLMGPVRRVSAMVATRAHERIEVEDVAVANLEFCNGALGTISATTASWPGIDKRIELHGSTGSAVIDEDRLTHWSVPERAGWSLAEISGSSQSTGQGGSGAADPSAIKHGLHAALYADFVAAIREGRAPMVDGVEGRKSAELVTTIYRAARTGGTIDLS